MESLIRERDTAALRRLNHRMLVFKDLAFATNIVNKGPWVREKELRCRKKRNDLSPWFNYDAVEWARIRAMVELRRLQRQKAVRAGEDEEETEIEEARLRAMLARRTSPHGREAADDNNNMG